MGYDSLFQDLLDASPEIIFVLDAGFRVVWANRAQEDILGFSRGETVGRDFRDILKGRFRCLLDKAEDFVDPLLASFEENRFPEHLICHVVQERSRREWWLRHRSQPVRSGPLKGGRVERFAEFSRKKAEEASWELGPAIINESCCRYLPRDREEFLGEDFLDLIPEVERNSLKRYLAGHCLKKADCAKELREFSLESLANCQNGKGRTFDERGALLDSTGIGRDLDSRMPTVEQLRLAENRFRRLSREIHTLLDGIPDAIYHLSADLKILWLNRTALEMLRKGGTDVKGGHSGEATDGATERGTKCTLPRLSKNFQGKKPATKEIHTFGGSSWEIRIFPVSAEGDETKCSLIVLQRDVTEKTILEQETRRSAHLVSLGELAAGVAHEINNPINGIVNYAQILSDRLSEGSREKSIADRIIKEGDRIAAIVKNLLSFARSGTENKNSIKIKEILLDALFLAQPQFQSNNIILKVDLDVDLPDVIAFPHQIQQVFLNILNNSTYALNEKFPGYHREKIIEVKGEKITKKEISYARITILDHGTGIPDNVLDEVMTPFFTTKPIGKGTGLGLSISHNIISDHGGWLEIESIPGKFTQVHIDLPIPTESAE